MVAVLDWWFYTIDYSLTWRGTIPMLMYMYMRYSLYLGDLSALVGINPAILVVHQIDCSTHRSVLTYHIPRIPCPVFTKVMVRDVRLQRISTEQEAKGK